MYILIFAPTGSGKSTALMKIIKESKDNNYIIFVPTNKKANNFNNTFYYKEDSIKLCISDGTFKNIELAFDSNVRVINYNYISHSIQMFR